MKRHGVEAALCEAGAASNFLRTSVFPEVGGGTSYGQSRLYTGGCARRF